MMNRPQVLAFSFLAITAGAWSYVVVPTINYLQYYSALDQLGVDVANMSVRSSTSNIIVTLEFAISNPTPYIGLRVVSLNYQAKLSNGSDSLPIGVGLVDTGPGWLSAHSSISLPANFVLTGLGMTQFTQLCDASQHRLSWSVEGTIGLGTRDGVLIHQFQIPEASSC